jgi:tetratricopeptide (TPR) repeat protein
MNKKKRELEQNELADALSTRLDRLRPHIPKIAMFSAVAILAIIAIAFYLNTRRAVSESQWREFFVSSRFADSRGMKTVAEIFPDTTVGNLALINAADSDYANGSVNIVRNRENYKNQVKQAVENYELVLQSANVDEFARLRATFALGYTYESLGRFDDARPLYEELLDQYPDTPEGELARKALERISDDRVRAIYAAFQQWAPPEETAPGDFQTGSSLPARPDISMPREMEQAPGFDPGAAADTGGDNDDPGNADPGETGDPGNGGDTGESGSSGEDDGQ